MDVGYSRKCADKPQPKRNSEVRRQAPAKKKFSLNGCRVQSKVHKQGPSNKKYSLKKMEISKQAILYVCKGPAAPRRLGLCPREETPAQEIQRYQL